MALISAICFLKAYSVFRKKSFIHIMYIDDMTYMGSVFMVYDFNV